MLHEISQIKRVNIRLHLYHVPRIGKFIETESRIETIRGLGTGDGEFLFRMMKNF